MKVFVTYTDEADREFDLWVRSLPGKLEDHVGFIVLYLEQLKEYLIASHGTPPEATHIEGSRPSRYRMPFLMGLRIEYLVEDETRWFWRTTRTITIVHFGVVR
jgi:hypothetical protein